MTEDYIKIKGGRTLSGTIEVYGAKNNVPKLMVAALLSNEESTIENISHVLDVEIVSEMVRALGGSVEIHDREAKIELKNIEALDEVKLEEFSGKSRIPILFSGPLLARTGRATIPCLGGCRIGERPINFHIDALKKLGAVAIEKPDIIYLKAEKLHGAKISFPFPSVMATEQVLITACLAEGKTVLENAAIEPEILNLIEMLVKMGARIKKTGERVFEIDGVEKLHGVQHKAISDRLEVASWACVAAVTKGRIFIKNAEEKYLTSFLEKYKAIGGNYEVGGNGIEFSRGKKNLSATDIETAVYPGFVTDWQQPFVVVLTQAHGVSKIHETVYENRFGYTMALIEMGADIKLEKECLDNRECRFSGKNHLHTAIITGPTALKSADIEIPDLRAGFSYVIAALVANSVSTIFNIKIIKRGYEDFLGKLKSLGAEIIETTLV